MRRLFFLLEAFFVLIFSAAAIPSLHHREPLLLFSVGNDRVYTDEFEFVFQKNNPQKNGQITKSDIDDYLTLFINFKLKVAEAKRRGMDTTQSFRQEFEKYHDEFRKPYLAESSILDSLVRLTYDRLKTEIQVAHILIAVAPDATPSDTVKAYQKALTIKKRLLSGEDFATLAKEYSDDPSAKSNGGELGYFTALQMVYPFETAAYQGEVGEIAGPVRTQFGYHLIRVESQRPASGTIEVSHIMIRTGANHSDEEAKKLIDSAYNELQHGRDWSGVCSTFSEDPNTKSSGGRLRPFGLRAMAGVPEFEKQAFALKNTGEYSMPFRTAFGWHIVRLENRTPLASFDEIKDQLERKVARDERATLSLDMLVESLEKKFDFSEDSTVRHKVLASADSSLFKGKWTPEFRPNQILFTFRNDTIRIADFVAYVRAHGHLNQVEPHQYIQEMYSAFVHDCLVDAQEERLKATNPEYRFLLKEYFEGILLFDIMEEEVWNKASVDTLGQQAYFNEHRNKYQYGPRIRADIYRCPSARLRDSLEAGFSNADSATIARMVGTKGVQKEAGDFERADRSYLANIEFSPGIFTVEEEGNYYLVRIKSVVPPGEKPYEAARAAVISDYQDQLEAGWISQLRSTFDVRINAKARKLLYHDLL